MELVVKTVKFIAGALVALQCAVNCAAVYAAELPNILWITVEDMSPTLGCYGDSYAKTPHVDQLARESVRYTNAFATSPVCSPARSTLITGIYSTTLGTEDLRSAFPLPAFVDAWPGRLRRLGYYTANNVKTDYNTSNESRLIAEAWNESSATAHWRNRPADAPFFAIFNDMVTHQSRTGVWPRMRFVNEVQSRLTPSVIHDPQEMEVPPYYPDMPEVRQGLARFYDCVSVMDQNVGELIAQIQADGLYDETIIFFYADHGSGMPRGKRVLHDSGMQVPLLIRFPPKYQHLAPAAPGSTDDRLVSFVDFPATVLSILGEEIPPAMQGKPFLGPQAVPPRDYVFGARGRVDEAYDWARSVRSKRFLYIRNFRPDLFWNQPSAFADFSAVRQTISKMQGAGQLNDVQQAYAGPTRPAEELYNVVNDPHNIHNLAGSEAFQPVLAEMRQALKDWMQQTRDVGFLAEEARWRILVEHNSVYEWAVESTQLPSDEIYTAADRIGRGPQYLEEQVQLLGSDNPILQLLGIYGLRSQSAWNDSAKDAVQRLSESPYGEIRVEAASLLNDLARLGRELQSTDPNIVLRASRALELSGKEAVTERKEMEAALVTWRGNESSPIPLFIQFSLEAALTNIGHPPEDRFEP